MGSRLVLDSNVLVSALGWQGPAMVLVRQCIDKKHQLLLSPSIPITGSWNALWPGKRMPLFPETVT